MKLEWIRTRKTIWRLSAAALLLAVLVGLAGEWIRQNFGERQAFSSARLSGGALILDAGHGGEDGGAVADDGTVESGINLAIVEKLDQLAGLYGIPALLTRSGEEDLSDPSADTLREQKRSDLENRVRLINEAGGDATLISIHQNAWPGSTGAQVFYGADGLSRQLAVHTQELLRQAVDPDNHRQAAAISDSVYLMSHISCTAILVECGFLTDAEETRKLSDPGYQTKLAAALLSAYLTFSPDLTSQQE